VRITHLGHAGLSIETRFGTILCDPWFSPAFFDSWHPFPRNDHLEWSVVNSPDFLYISHGHRDHFDRTFLETVDKRTNVLLPDFALRDHEAELRHLGFSRFIRCGNEPVVLDGLRLAIEAETDEPTGDSALMVDDGTACLLNQNDARPLSMERIMEFGDYDVHFVQFSGAMWYPHVYRWSAEERRARVLATRSAQALRALGYIDQVDAALVIPFAGPACFLDDELSHLNDIPGLEPTIFVDQYRFLSAMRESGRTNGQLVFPGSVVDLECSRREISHLAAEDALVDAIYVNKAQYLVGYASDWRVRKSAANGPLAVDRVSWDGFEALVASLREWLVPLMRQADAVCDGIGGSVLFSTELGGVVLDFPRREVNVWRREHCPYRFYLQSALLIDLVANHEVDWVNSLFLSCRFEAERDDEYNEWLYTFFKGLNSDRLRHLVFAYQAPTPDETWVCDGWELPRRCPHFRADLKEFGSIQDGVLTCAMHGWRFDLETGECLTARGRRLDARRVVNDGRRDEDGRENDRMSF
jgi:UDP-MurNAc hydroxylase